MTSVDTDGIDAKLASVGVETRRASPDAAVDAIDEAVEEPAVGVSLDDFDVSLDETSVTVDPTPAALKAATTGVTPASLCVADYGTVVLPTREDGTELVSLFVDHHVVVLREADVVPDMQTAFDEFGSDPREARESRILATGPSATADMGALVEGAHGPKRVTAVVLTDG